MIVRYFRGEAITPTPSPTPSAAPTVTATASPTNLPTTEVSNTDVHGLFSDYDSSTKNLYYIDAITSEPKRYNFSTRDMQTLGEALPAIEALAWSPNHQKILVRTQNLQGNEVFNPFYQENKPADYTGTALYDITSKATVFLNENITSFSFLSDDQIIYQYRDFIFNNLSISQPNGKGWKNIVSLDGSVVMQRIGSTVSIQGNEVTDAIDPTVIRYGIDGKQIDSFELPENVSILNSICPQKDSCIVWDKLDDSVVISSVKGGNYKTIGEIDEDTEDFEIVWDNSEKNVYALTSSGLRLVGKSEDL
jgi:hypothetical protein